MNICMLSWESLYRPRDKISKENANAQKIPFLPY